MPTRHDISFLHNEPSKQSFTSCQLIFKEGEVGDVMYGVISGEVDIVIGGRVVEIAGPGSILGEMALIDGAPRSATVKAAIKSEVVRLPGDAGCLQPAAHGAVHADERHGGDQFRHHRARMRGEQHFAHVACADTLDARQPRAVFQHHVAEIQPLAGEPLANGGLRLGRRAGRHCGWWRWSWRLSS